MANKDNLKKVITVPIEADTRKADERIDNTRKKASELIEIPIDIDLKDIKKALNTIEGMIGRIGNAFDKDVKFSGLQKGLQDLVKDFNSVMKTFNSGKPAEFKALKVDLVNFSKLTNATEIIQKNIESLNDSKIDLSSFDKLSDVLKNIESILSSIKTGLNFETIRPSAQVQNDIVETTKKLEELEKSEKRIQKLEKYFNGTGIRKGREIIEWGDSDEVSALDNFISKLKEYISLGGDLSKFNFKVIGLDGITTEYQSLLNVYEILQDEGKIDFIDESEIANDVNIIKTLRTELTDLNKELEQSKLRENRDLNVSLDTKSVEDFSSAITQAIQAVGQLNINIPENFSFDGLSIENLDKIIDKLDIVVNSLKNISDYLTTGIDTSKLRENLADNINKTDENLKVKVDIEPEFNPNEFIQKIEDKIVQSNKSVKIKTVLTDDSQENIDIIDDSVFNSIKENFNNISSDFGFSLSENISDFKEELEITSQKINYENIFKPLKNVLLGIVEQFQNSLQNVNLSSTQLNDSYKILKGWNDADAYASRKTGITTGERGAFFNSKTGATSNAFIVDESGSFRDTLFDALKDLSVGLDGEISSIYDTWVHSHPFKDTHENLVALGSDIGLSIADLDLGIDKLLKDNLPKMLLTNNYKFTELDLGGITEEIAKQLLDEYRKELLKAGLEEINIDGKRKVSFPSSLAKHNGIYDLDKKSEIMNNALLKALSNLNLDSNRLKTGNINELNFDLSNIGQDNSKNINDAKELLTVLNNISDVLKEVKDAGVFKFEGIDSLTDNLEQIKETLVQINKLLTDGVNVNSKTNISEKPSLEELSSSSEKAAEAKIAIKNANEQVQDSVDDSKSKLELETELMERLAIAARQAADAKKEFVEANEKVQKSVDNISSNINNDTSSGSNKKEPENPRTSSEATKYNKEVVANYKALINSASEYYDLKERNTYGALSKEEIIRLNELDDLWERATKKLDEYSVSLNGSKDSIRNVQRIQEKFINEQDEIYKQSLEGFISSTKKNSSKLKNTPDKYTDSYLNELKTIDDLLENIRKLTPIDLTDETKVKEVADYKRQINEILESAKDDKNTLAKSSEVYKLQADIFENLQRNSGMSSKLKAEFNALGDELASYKGKIPNSELERFRSEFQRLRSEMEKAGKVGKDFFGKIKDKIVYGWADIAARYLGLQDVIRYIQNIGQKVTEYNSKLTEMRKVSDETVATLKEFQRTSFDLADGIGATADAIQNSTADFMRLGYELEDADDLAVDANIYANVGDMEIEEATEHMISSIQAWKSEFSSEVEASSAIIDRYNEIGNNFAITSADIGSAMERSAAALKAGGNTLNESLGLITAGNLIQQDADTTANALKVVSLRIRGSKADLEAMGESTDDLAESSSKCREELKALTGVDIMLDEKTYKSTAQIIQEIGENWTKLTDVSQAATLELLAGKTRASVMAGLIENYEVIEDVIEAAENAEGSALRENERYLESIEGHIAVLSNAWDKFVTSLIDSGTINFFLDLATAVVNLGEKLVNLTSPLGMLASIGAGVASFNGLGLTNYVTNHSLRVPFYKVA